MNDETQNKTLNNNLVIPSSLFTTKDLPVEEKYTAWKEAISSVFTVEPLGESTELNFEASIESHMMGEMLISKTSSTNQRFVRNKQNITIDNSRYMMLEIMLKGTHTLETEYGPRIVNTGDIVIYDMRQPYTFEASGEFDGRRHEYTDMDFVFPLEVIKPLLPQFEQFHRHVIAKDELANTLIKNHLLCIYSLLPQISNDVAATISKATAQMLASLINIEPQLKFSAKNQREKNHLLNVHRIVMDNLSSSELDINFICQELKISKSSLYRICAPYGGIMKMVRVRRLRNAYNMLTEPTPPQVTQVALQCGFGNIDSFTRAFKREFGFKPSNLINRPEGFSAENAQRPDYQDLLRSFSNTD